MLALDSRICHPLLPIQAADRQHILPLLMCCRIVQVAIRRHPLEGGLTPWTALSVTYLTLFAAYWLVALVRGV